MKSQISQLRVPDSPKLSLRVPGTSSLLLLSFRSNWKGEEDAVGSSSTQLLIKGLEIFLSVNRLPLCITHLPGGSLIYQARGKPWLGIVIIILIQDSFNGKSMHHFRSTDLPSHHH